MLFLFDLFSKNQNTDKKEINAQCYSGMFFTLFPSLFHFFAPVDIIQYYDRKVIGFGKNSFEVFDGWLKAMIAVDKGEIYSSQLVDDGWQCIVKISFDSFYIVELLRPEILCCNV